MTEIRASLRFLRMSPRKVRLVLATVHGLPTAQAEHVLKFSNTVASQPLLKLLRSAIANAKVKKHDGTLYVRQAFVDQGPTLKRYRPRAFGAAAPIRKRSSHVTIVLGEVKSEELKVKK